MTVGLSAGRCSWSLLCCWFYYVLHILLTFPDCCPAVLQQRSTRLLFSVFLSLRLESPYFIRPFYGRVLLLEADCQGQRKLDNEQIVISRLYNSIVIIHSFKF